MDGGAKRHKLLWTTCLPITELLCSLMAFLIVTQNWPYRALD